MVAISRLGVDRIRTAGREHAPFLVRLADGDDILARGGHRRLRHLDPPRTCSAPTACPPTARPRPPRSSDHALPDVLGADRDRFAGRHTVVVGAGHSAANTLLALAELAEQAPGTAVTWAIRSGSPARTYGGEAADALPGRGALGSGLRMLRRHRRGSRSLTGFAVHTVRPVDGRVQLSPRRRRRRQTLTADRVVAATGFRPDHTIAAELRLDLDPILGSTRALAPLIDPNEHSCGTVPPHGVDELAHPEPGYYAVGVKSYGRAPTFLLATGYEQVRSIAAALAGDWTAARDVQLDLPETGVCNTNLGARRHARRRHRRYGLAPDVPAKLRRRHRPLPAAGRAEATRASPPTRRRPGSRRADRRPRRRPVDRCPPRAALKRGRTDGTGRRRLLRLSGRASASAVPPVRSPADGPPAGAHRAHAIVAALAVTQTDRLRHPLLRLRRPAHPARRRPAHLHHRGHRRVHRRRPHRRGARRPGRPVARPARRPRPDDRSAPSAARSCWSTLVHGARTSSQLYAGADRHRPCRREPLRSRRSPSSSPGIRPDAAAPTPCSPSPSSPDSPAPSSCR